MVYELWKCDDGWIMLPPEHPQHDKIVPDKAELASIIDAPTWDEAKRQYELLTGGTPLD